MVDSLNTMLANILTVFLVISCIFSLAQCLFGYRLLKVSCAIVGFLLGLLIGYIIGVELIHLDSAWPWLPAAIMAIILGFLSYRLFLVGFFILTFVMSFFLALGIPLPRSTTWDIICVVIAFIIGILAAVLAVRYNKVVAIFATAILGAYHFITSLDKLTHLINGNTLIHICAVSIVAFVGLLLQLLMNRRVK